MRRQRASGRRRSAPRPVHGASTSTRSNDPSRQAGRVPSAATTPSSPAPAPRWPRRPARPGAPAARWPAAGRPRSRPARRAARPCRRDRRTGRASARRARRPRRRRSASGDQLGPLVLHPGAALARRPAPRPGRRRRAPRRTASSAEAVPPAATSSSTVDSPGRATRVTLGGCVVGGQQGVELAGAVAERLGERVDDPARVGVRDGREARPGRRPGRARPGATQPARSWADDLAQHGVDEARTGPGRPWPGPGRRWCRPRRATGTRIASSWWVPSRSASRTGGVDLGQRPVDAGGDHRVVGALPADRPGRPARWRTRRRGRSARGSRSSGGSTRLV